jgi:hypothetical protein
MLKFIRQTAKPTWKRSESTGTACRQPVHVRPHECQIHSLQHSPRPTAITTRMTRARPTRMRPESVTVPFGPAAKPPPVRAAGPGSTGRIWRPTGRLRRQRQPSGHSLAGGGERAAGAAAAAYGVEVPEPAVAGLCEREVPPPAGGVAGGRVGVGGGWRSGGGGGGGAGRGEGQAPVDLRAPELENEGLGSASLARWP